MSTEIHKPTQPDTEFSTSQVSLITGHTLPSHDVCILCGVLLHAHQDRRSKTVRTFSAMLHNRWKPTPYTWSIIQNVCQNAKSENERLTACMACINWIRRSVPTNECANRATHRRTFLLIDRLICFSMAPGEINSPDLRNMRRLIRCLKQKETIEGKTFTNYYMKVIPPHLQSVISGCHSDTFDDIYRFVHLVIKRWWHDIANETPFFRNPDTAYLVRKAVSHTTYDSIKSVVSFIDTDDPIGQDGLDDGGKEEIDYLSAIFQGSDRGAPGQGGEGDPEGEHVREAHL